MPKGIPEIWTDEEIQFLISNYYKIGSKKTAQILKKSNNCIRSKASKLKIKGRRLTVAEQNRNAQEKKCTKCEKVKPFIEFSKSNSPYAYNRSAWCKECINAYSRERNKRPDILKKANESKKKIRHDVLFIYSKGTMKCSCCGESHIEFLCIDHIYGGGNKHHKEIKRLGHSFYGWLRKNNYPEGFQVLCHNCNMAKSFYGICPHQKNK